jgi:hypothetical protein
MTSFERSWLFRFPTVIRNPLSLFLVGVAYTAAIFEGVMRGLEIGVVDPEAEHNSVDWDVTAELPTED